MFGTSVLVNKLLYRLQKFKILEKKSHQLENLKCKKPSTSSAQNNGRSPVIDWLKSLSDWLKSFTNDHCDD